MYYTFISIYVYRENSRPTIYMFDITMSDEILREEALY